MTAVYVFDECAQGDHKKCPGERDMPTDPETCGGKICICECHQGTR